MPLPIQWTNQTIVGFLLLSTILLAPAQCQAQEIGSAISQIKLGGKGIAQASVATSKLGASVFGSPAIAGNAMFVRSVNALWKIASN